MRQYFSQNSGKNTVALPICCASFLLMACAPYPSHTVSPPPVNTTTAQSPIHDPCETQTDDVQCAFQNGLNAAVSGFPIEGLSAVIILREFAGIRPSDFEGVQASQGVYYTKKGMVQFKLIAEFEHSAARTISHQGYAQLRRNIENRLGVRASSPQHIRHILSDLKAK